MVHGQEVGAVVEPDVWSRAIMPMEYEVVQVFHQLLYRLPQQEPWMGHHDVANAAHDDSNPHPKLVGRRGCEDGVEGWGDGGE